MFSRKSKIQSPKSKVQSAKAEDQRPKRQSAVSNVLYYAMGGGLGHLTRARAVLNMFGIEEDSLILTSSPFANDVRVMGETKVINVPQDFEKKLADFRLYLADIFEQSNATELFIDTFPAGIIGEFCDFDFKDLQINYVARSLKWNAYLPLIYGNLPKIQTTFLLEPLEEEHKKFVVKNSLETVSLDLVYPKTFFSDEYKSLIDSHSPFWLIIHSGNDEEIKELLDYANEMRVIENANVNLVLITPKSFSTLPSKTFHYDLYPASTLFPYAERIISGCGFNIVTEARKFRDKHCVIPFPRRYDDQFKRTFHAFQIQG